MCLWLFNFELQQIKQNWVYPPYWDKMFAPKSDIQKKNNNKKIHIIGTPIYSLVHSVFIWSLKI